MLTVETNINHWPSLFKEKLCKKFTEQSNPVDVLVIDTVAAYESGELAKLLGIAAEDDEDDL